MRTLLLVVIALAAFVQGCAALNPNPNTGMRTTDLMFSGGDCEGAKKVAEPAALRGEPWAQYRMGALLLDERCPNKSVKNIPAAIEWLGKAACYESKSAWERGNELAVGPTGYFNSRASSTNAAVMLSDVYLALKRAGLARYYIERVRGQYGEDEDTYQELSKRLGYIESLMAPGQLAAIKKENTDVCLVSRN